MATILKPIKISKQRVETPEDVTDIINMLSSNMKENEFSHNTFISHGISNPSNLLYSPDDISAQITSAQIALLPNDEINGKRIYPIIYILPYERYQLTMDEGIQLASELLQTYDSFISMASISTNDENKDIAITCVFNNYSIDGKSKMTKAFRPYDATNIFRKIKKNSTDTMPRNE